MEPNGIFTRFRCVECECHGLNLIPVNRRKSGSNTVNYLHAVASPQGGCRGVFCYTPYFWKNLSTK